MQEEPQAQSKSATTSRADQPTNVAGLMAQVEADFWKMRAQMLIYHQEKVAARQPSRCYNVTRHPERLTIW